jgi:FkbM family methyltransferase
MQLKTAVWAVVRALRTNPRTRALADRFTLLLVRWHVVRATQAAAVLNALHSDGTGVLRAPVRFRSNRVLQLEVPRAGIDLLVFPLFEHPREGTTYRVFAGLARYARSACDVGANVGSFSYLAVTAMPSGGTVVAVEPVPAFAACIERNVSLNRLTGLRVIRAAAGDRAGSAVLYVPFGNGEGASLHADWAGADAAQINVCVERLDVLLPCPPDLIKVDVEQHEQAVIDGLAGVLAHARPDLIVELVGSEAHRIGVATRLVDTYGYCAYYIARQLHRTRPESLPYEPGFFNFLFTTRPADELRRLVRMPVS